jgi:hypothetical protein
MNLFFKIWIDAGIIYASNFLNLNLKHQVYQAIKLFANTFRNLNRIFLSSLLANSLKIYKKFGQFQPCILNPGLDLACFGS